VTHYVIVSLIDVIASLHERFVDRPFSLCKYISEVCTYKKIEKKKQAYRRMSVIRRQSKRETA